MDESALVKSELCCFFHAKLPGKTPQQETDARIFAASKWIYCFDQLRIVHEQTTDPYEIVWATFVEESATIVTVSQRNVTIWDALMGTKKTT